MNKAEGYLESYDLRIRDGQITVAQGKENLVDELKQAYTGEMISKAAKRFGWIMSKKTGNKLTLRRR